MAESVDLFQILGKLDSVQLKRFRSYLSEYLLEGFNPISGGNLDNSDARDVVEKMKQFYTGDSSTAITLHILKKIDRNDLVDEIETQTEIPTTDQQR